MGSHGFFQRSLKKGVQDAAKSRARFLRSRPAGKVDEGQSFLAVLHMPFLFQDAQQGADGGFAGRISQGGVDLDRRGLSFAKDDFHDLPLAAAERIGAGHVPNPSQSIPSPSAARAEGANFLTWRNGAVKQIMPEFWQMDRNADSHARRSP